MSGLLIAVTLGVMVVGVVGTVLPLLPGLLLIWAAGVGSWWIAGFGPTGWFALVLLTLLLVAGTVAKYVLPGRTGRARAVARRSLITGLAAGIVGFFVVPLVGFIIGGLLGVFLAETNRTGDRDRALDNTMAMLKSFGLGVLVESGAGIAMIAVWLATVLVAGID